MCSSSLKVFSIGIYAFYGKVGDIVIKYLGSKRVLLPWIGETVQKVSSQASVIDLFSGTSRVGHFLKRLGYQVHSNDLNTYAYALAKCYVASDWEEHQNKIPALLEEMQKLDPREGFFCKNYCVDARFFQPQNGARIDAMRDWIEEQNINEEERAILLVALMEAADRVDSTCGLQMAYLKKWAQRSYHDIELRMPELLPRSVVGKGSATNMDALDAAKILSADIAYLDPPYNQHKYLGNYHIWESLIRWDKPEVYGVARKRVDVKERVSPFNRKRQIQDALKSVVDSLDVKHIIVSFNNEGYISKEEMIQILSVRGDVCTLENTHKRYVGAQIGIHNQDGEKVGAVSHTKNTEYLFVVSEDKDVYSRLEIS